MIKHSKHPAGLNFLFFTEMWERFGYYLMIGIFQLYLTESEDAGGMGMDRKQAADIYGTFIALVFLTPFIGGLLADRVLGYVKSVFIGGTLMGIGYLGLSIHHLTTFYISLSFIIIGNGFFKPNISTLLGNLYNDPAYKENKDAGYNIFYMGINIGACICNLFAAYMRNRYGWGYAFATAGIGMFLGLMIFLWGLRRFRHADIRKETNSTDMSLNRILATVLLPAVLIGLVGWIIPGNLLGSDSTDAFIFACIPVVLFYASLYFRAEASEKKSIGALLTVMLVSVMFWAVFKQNGTALTTWAQFYTNREVPATIQPLTSKLYLSEKIIYKIDSVNAYNEQFQLVKNNGKAVKTWDYPVYFRNYDIQNKPQENQEVFAFNTELYQSINPFWVILLTPVVLSFFKLLRKRNREPATATKIAIGLAISAISTLVMVWAVQVCSNGAIKASSGWLIACYGVVTIGELFLSPMGLALVSRTSPQRITSLMMGGWFLATSIGNKLSGILATLWDSYQDKTHFFLVNFTLLSLAAILLFLLLKRLNNAFNK